MANKIKKPTLYEILQVRDDACPEVIRAAWKARMVLVHPDKGGKDNLAARLNEAKETLLDSGKRKVYDEDVGKTLGNYRVVREIAEGGFGVTYEAEHLILGEKACLKQCLHVSEEDNELLRNEAKLLWDIHHYSLPTLRDFFQTSDGSCVLAMSYVEGPSLDKIVEKHKAIEPEHVCWITQRLLNALHYLHFKGIVHCDVKPNNIIIKPDEHNAVLVDYGFASIRPKQITRPNGYTEIFAAPELIALKPPLPQSDFYSLGLTAIYALGGNPITKKYPKDTPQEIVNYFDRFLENNPLRRPSWESEDIVKNLSDVRLKVFGRRSSNKSLEI
jgi:serine/threonine protein kinase